MATKITISRVFKMAFLLDEQLLLRIVNVLKEISEKIDYEIQCSDSSSLEFSSAEELLKFSNIRERQITSISLNTPWEKKPLIRLKFRLGSFYTPIEYTIIGDERESLYYADKLNENISASRQWYSPIAFLDFTMMLLCVFGVTLVVLFIFAMIMLIGSDLSQVIKKEETRKDFLIKNFIWFIIIPLFALGTILNFLRKKIFPVATFAMGEGLTRYRSVVFWRRTVGISFGLSLIASIIAGWLMK